MITYEDILAIRQNAILNELIEVNLFEAKRTSNSLTKRELVARDGKIICPRDFCNDDRMLGKLIRIWTEKNYNFQIIHNIYLKDHFLVEGRSKEISCCSGSLGEAFCKTILMELLCHD